MNGSSAGFGKWKKSLRKQDVLSRMPTCRPSIVSGRWRKSRPPERPGVFHILCGLTVDSPVENPLSPCPEGPSIRLPFFWASRIRTQRFGAPGRTLRLCPPFFLLRGYPSSAKLVLGRPPSEAAQPNGCPGVEGAPLPDELTPW